MTAKPVKWKVTLVYKETFVVEDIEADDEISAIRLAAEQTDHSNQVDYAWLDASAKKIKEI